MPTFSGLLGIALASGVNLYATVLTLGLGIRYGWIHGLPDELRVLGHPAILIIAGVLYAVEFLADKIPFITPFWDAVHTFIRPLGAALLAAQASSNLDPVVRMIAILLSGSVALATHSTKMGARLAAHAVPDPVTHSALSVGEDVGAISLLVLAWSHPLIALPILLGVLVGAVLLLRMFYRTLKGAPGWIRARFARSS